MLRDEAVAIIQEELGFRSDKATLIIARLKEAQREYEDEAELPWFLQSEVSSVSTVSGEERVPLPADFLREFEDDAVYYFNAAATEDADKWTPLAKDEIEFLRSAKPGVGPPEAYATDAKYHRIFPTPDAAYVLKQIYYKQATVLDANIENEWLKRAPWLLIGWAGQRVGSPLRDKAAIATFKEMEQRQRNKLFVATEARRHAGRRYMMGDPD